MSQELISIQEQINSLPDGYLSCVKNGNYYRWYNHIDNKIQNISKRNIDLLKAMATKKYLSEQFNEKLKEKQALELYLNNFNPDNCPSSHLLDDDSHFKPLLSSMFTPNSEIQAQWCAKSYEQNPYMPEKKIHRSTSGNLVRSKSEALIDMALFNNKIPFRYECKLQLEDFTFYPDFTILHPTTSKIYYWEHCGMMDDSSYRKHLYEKFNIYNNHGIIQTVNLITTYETIDYPLDSIIIRDIIQHYFLD